MPLGTDLLAIARTDSEAATLITSTIDPRDHGFILGTTNPAVQPLSDLMVAGEQAGKTGDQLQAIEDQWNEQAGLKLFNDAVVDAINAGAHGNKKALIDQFLKSAKGKSNSEARAIAKSITGTDIYWDWDAARTREGYYRYQGGCQCAINRALAYSPFADLIWMESKLPDYAQAKEFAEGVHAVFPHQKFVLPNMLLAVVFNANKNHQACLQPLSLFQLEDRHAPRRARDIHQASRRTRILLAIHHPRRSTHHRTHQRPLRQGVLATRNASIRRDGARARNGSQGRCRHAPEMERSELCG